MAQVQRSGKSSKSAGNAVSGKPQSAPIARGDAEPDPALVDAGQDTIGGDLRHRLISEAAYRIYAERGYVDGYDLDDWLQAEAAVDHPMSADALHDSDAAVQRIPPAGRP
jgi:Protein of unknown function (DUF2934)